VRLSSTQLVASAIAVAHATSAPVKIVICRSYRVRCCWSR
jgi:hypothetical protein